MKKTMPEEYKAVNGLSYTVQDIVLTDVPIYFIRRVIGNILGHFISDRFYVDGWLKKPRSLIKAVADLRIELNAGKFPKDISDTVKVIIPVTCAESMKRIISSKDNKLSCSYCDKPSGKKHNRGRECFHKGGRHNIKLMFFSSDILRNEDDVQDYCVPVEMLWRRLDMNETKNALDLNKKMSRAFEIPINILHKNRLNVYMLSPRECVKKDFYFWQYRLIDKFITEEAFTGYCHLCGAKKLRVLNQELGYDFTSPYTMSFENILAEMDGLTKRPEFKVKLAWCETCREYSSVFNKSAFEEFLVYFTDRGLCSNCYSSVEWKDKNIMNLQRPECSHVTPIYERQVVKKITT